MSNPRSPFRLNVGFIVHQSIGYSRDFQFDIPKVHLAPDLDLSNLTGTVRVTRTPQGLPVQVQMRAMLENVECGRCLRSFENLLKIEFTEMYAFPHRGERLEGELALPEDYHLDLEPLVREYMLLEVPINPLCKEDCKGLCPVCGENLNDNEHDHGPETGDPRLAVLKSLLEEQEKKDDADKK